MAKAKDQLKPINPHNPIDLRKPATENVTLTCRNHVEVRYETRNIAPIACRTIWLAFSHFGKRHQVRIGSGINRTAAREIARSNVPLS